jgi:hypothetical protein
MLKDDGTGTLSRSGGNGDGTAKHLVGSLPSSWLADIIRGRRDAVWKCCRLVAMSSTTMTTTVRMTTGGFK